MRKTIIFAALLIVSSAAMSQATQPPKPAHPGYNPDLSTPLTISLTVPAALANAFLVVNGSGGPEAVKYSKAPSNQVQAILKQYQSAMDSIQVRAQKALTDWNIKASAKFTADTIALYHGGKPLPDKPVKK